MHHNELTTPGDDDTTLECELFERLVDAGTDSQHRLLNEIREQTPEMCARLEKLLKIHSAAEHQTALQVPQEIRYRQGDKIDDYEIIHFLASGGEADVYLARQSTLVDRDVAIKVLRRRSGASTDYLSRFQSEKAALARLIHPGIAKIFDAGVTPRGEHYCAVEYVAGPTVTEFLAGQDLLIRERLEVFVEICGAVQYANENGIFHRDLKPSNIIVSDTDGRHRPVVIDFGIAKVDNHSSDNSDTLTHQGDLLGTLGYIAPERLDDARVSNSQSEVYSLGAVLYEMICQQPIFSLSNNRGIVAALESLRNNDIVKPSERLKQNGSSSRSLNSREQFAAELDWICLKAVERDPQRRYASVRELRKDVCRCLDGQSVEAAPPGRWYIATKFYQRHRLVCILSMMLLVMLAVLSVGTTYWALKLDKARRAADLLAAKSQNDSLHLSTVLEFMITAFDDEEESFGAVAVCGEQLLNSPALERKSRRNLQYNSATGSLNEEATESQNVKRQHNNPLAANYANPSLPQAVLVRQRIRFFDQFLEKQVDQFGETSPFVVQTLLDKAEIEIGSNSSGAQETLSRAQSALRKLGRNDSDPLVQEYVKLSEKARE